MTNDDDEDKSPRRHRSTEDNLRWELRQAEQRFWDERDRRYTEVAAEREKALKIKEAADEKALTLASKIQAYKDEKANNLRDQIAGERGEYVTRNEIKPIADYVVSQQGRSSGAIDMRTLVFALFGMAAAIVVVIQFLQGLHP